MSSKAVDFLKWIYQRCEIGNINLRFLGGKFPLNEFAPLSSLEENPSMLDAILRDYASLNCYFAPALREGSKGKKEGITQVPILWVDDPSSAKLSQSPWPPSAINNTSPGKFQAIWKLREPAVKSEIPQVENLLKRLAGYFQGDFGCVDASHILRVPGTHNFKYNSAPTVSIQSMKEIEYCLDDFDDLPEMQSVPAIAASRNGDRLEKIMGCRFLQHGDQDQVTLPEPQWYGMISILAREAGGRELIHSLSKGYPKYSAKETDDKILHALNAGPLTCQKIKSFWNCGRDCGITSPVRLPFKKPETAAPVSIDFPKDVIGGLAGEFAETYSSYLEVPPHFFFMAFLTCLGHVLADRITLASELSPQPRLYVILLGESADDRKSTGISKTVDFFRDMFIEAGSFCMSWGMGSAEGFQKRLEENNRLLLCFDEFKQFVSKCKIESSVLLPCVNTLFESNRYESRTKTSHVYLENAYLSLLAASTISTYENTWSGQFTDIGFNNRLFLVPGSGERKFSIPVKIPEDKRKYLKRRLAEIMRLSSAHSELTINPAAWRAYDSWYLNLEKSMHVRRIETYAIRFLPLLAVNELKTVVDEETVRKVMALCNWQIEVRRLHDPVDADNEVAKMEEKVRRTLRVKGALKPWDLRRHTNADKKGLWVFDTALKNLSKAGEIDFNRKEKTYFLKHQGISS